MFPARFSVAAILEQADGAILSAVKFRRRYHSVLEFLLGCNVLGTRFALTREHTYAGFCMLLSCARRRGGFILAETLVQNGTGGVNGTVGGTVYQPVLGFLVG